MKTKKEAYQFKKVNKHGKSEYKNMEITKM